MRSSLVKAGVNHDGHAGLLDDLMARVAPCFARRETRLTCRRMVNGLLSELDDYDLDTYARINVPIVLLGGGSKHDQRTSAPDWTRSSACYRTPNAS